MLLDKGANLEAVDEYGDKPLHKGAENGHDKIISLLLDKGADLECAAKNGETALIRAAKNASVYAVTRLLERGVDTSVKDQSCGWSALHWAIVEGHKIVV